MDPAQLMQLIMQMLKAGGSGNAVSAKPVVGNQPTGGPSGILQSIMGLLGGGQYNQPTGTPGPSNVFTTGGAQPTAARAIANMGLGLGGASMNRVF